MGPAGSGKTTISELLATKLDFKQIDGEFIDSKYFPKGGQWLPENLEKLQRAHDDVLAETKKAFDDGKNNVVVDYIIFGDYISFINNFKKVFEDNLVMRVLMPEEKELVRRDAKRECWTAGPEHIKRVMNELSSIKNIIGEENYINTTNQTPEETFQKYFELLSYLKT